MASTRRKKVKVAWLCAKSVIAVFSTLLIALVMTSPAANASRLYTNHSGYLASTDGEREARYSDLVLIQAPKEDDGPSLRERIFNDKLSKEFRERYEEKFGRTEVERIYFSPNRYTFYNDSYGFKGSATDLNRERQSFAEFMLRRLGEYHVENYAKSDPAVRPIWEAKERLSELKVEVQQVRIDLKYQTAGNIFELKILNPWFDLAKVEYMMNPGVIGPTSPDEVIISLGRSITDKVAVEGHYYVMNAITTYIGRRAINERLSTSLTVSTFTSDQGRGPGPWVRESVYLAGVGYQF